MPVRFQIEITKEQLDELEKLRSLGGLKTKKELFDNAFTLLRWAANKKTQGLSVGSMNEFNEFAELEMPFLDHVGRSQPFSAPEIRRTILRAAPVKTDDDPSDQDFLRNDIAAMVSSFQRRARR